jgi:hypothetical protein
MRIVRVSCSNCTLYSTVNICNTVRLHSGLKKLSLCDVITHNTVKIISEKQLYRVGTICITYCMKWVKTMFVSMSKLKSS